MVAIGGWNWTLKPLAPKFSHLNPIAGLGRLLTGQGFGSALKAVALALVLGIGLVMVTGWLWLDAVVAIGVALNILREGAHLIWRSSQGLMDEALEPEVVATIRDTLQGFEHSRDGGGTGKAVSVSGYTISGTGYQAGATVTMGGVAASNVTVVGSTSITATTPAVASKKQ